jgi:hypothetical protein
VVEEGTEKKLRKNRAKDRSLASNMVPMRQLLSGGVVKGEQGLSESGVAAHKAADNSPLVPKPE